MNKISGYYNKRMCHTNGASSLSARIVVGAIIITHQEELSDQGTIEAIQVNSYMQYFFMTPS